MGVVGAINPLWPGATLVSSMAGGAAALALWTTRLGHLLSAGGLIALVLYTRSKLRTGEASVGPRPWGFLLLVRPPPLASLRRH
jgi:hypothetical protein